MWLLSLPRAVDGPPYGAARYAADYHGRKDWHVAIIAATGGWWGVFALPQRFGGHYGPVMLTPLLGHLQTTIS